MDGNHIAAFIHERCRAQGFDASAITRPESIGKAGTHLTQFLDRGWQGSMAWMADTAGRRADPLRLWPEVRSIVVVAMNYGPDADPLAGLDCRDRGTISVYARNRDYHDVMKGRLKQIAGQLVARAGGDVKVFVDTAPVMEKPLAAAAGLGWQGKHTNLVSRDFGSWLFLGALFTTLDLPADVPGADHCGRCRKCLDICPTDAFPAPYQLDARLCISYLTIEHDGPIPHALRPAMGNRIYGCDDCLAVCPWNKFARRASEAKLIARSDLKAPPLAELAALDDKGFRKFFVGSPIKRIGRDRFVRNVLIAIGNSGSRALIEPAQRLFDDPSDQVRGAAIWALSRLLETREFVKLRARRLPAETDPAVRAEWEVGAD